MREADITIDKETTRQSFSLRKKLILAVGSIGLLLSAQSGTAGVISYTFKTDITEINSGTGNATDFMTIQINQAVGPIDCRSNVLKVGDDPLLRQKIETLAMSALVQQDQVMIRIPVSRGDCIDGSPAILDMFLLHNS